MLKSTHAMKRLLRRSLSGIMLLFSGLSLATLTGCIDTSYENVQPVGYQNVFNDDFQGDQLGWSFDDNFNDAHLSIYGGELKYSYYPDGSGVNQTTVHTGMPAYGDWLIQTRISSNNAMALSFGAGNGEFGYTFFVDADGYFAVYDEGNNNAASVALIDWTPTNTVRNGYNDVELEQLGNTWVGYINGTEVFRTAARTLYGDRVGYSVLHNTTGYAEYLTVKW